MGLMLSMKGQQGHPETRWAVNANHQDYEQSKRVTDAA